MHSNSAVGEQQGRAQMQRNKHILLPRSRVLLLAYAAAVHPFIQPSREISHAVSKLSL